MKFNDPREVDQLFYDMRLADYPRGLNRRRINDLFNGVPPYSQEEVDENNISINVNSLEGTRISHDARSQFYQAFLKPGNYFKCTTDMGVVDKRQERSAVVTKEINRIMKRSLHYFECFRSKFASLVLHGIGPAVWSNRDLWCPEPVGIEDVLVPANTLLTMKNLPFYFVYRSFTVPELINLTRRDKVDKGWNTKLVNKCIAWADAEAAKLSSSNWGDVWSVEKQGERMKGDGGVYAGDQVPTIDCADFYFWSDEGKTSGWRRRIILDSWSNPQSSGGAVNMARNSELSFAKDEFLYDSGSRRYADQREQMISFQFADLSAVAPFRYHSVRSLGFLLFAVCHLQNRLRCRFNETVFESMMMYFRIKSMEESQRALKLNLISKGFIDDTIQFVPAADRFQVDADLVGLGLQQNQQLITENSSSYTQNQNFSRDRVEKTKFQVMAEVNAMTSLVSAGLLQAYTYQTAEYLEIFRRFCNKQSQDPEVLQFRARVLAQDVPERMLNPSQWEIEPERVMGAGNKTLEMAIAQQLMEYRNLYDPEAQRQILRDVTLAITDDPARAHLLVSEQPKISDSVHDAQLAAGSLMQGLPVATRSGINQTEYVETLLASMAFVLQGTQATQMAPVEKIVGLQNLAQHISQHIQLVAQDKNEKSRVKVYGDQLGKMMNLVKALAQRAAEQQGQGAGGPDPETIAKIENDKLLAQSKMENTTTAHAQRTAQRQLQFEQQMKQDAEKHQMEIETLKLEHQAELEKIAIETRQAIALAKLEAANKPKDPKTPKKE